MNRLNQIISFLGVLCLIGMSIFFLPSSLDKKVYEQWSCIKPDAPQKKYDEVIAYCRKHNLTVHDLVQSFIQRKKDAAITAVHKEWNINWNVLAHFQHDTDTVRMHMQRSQKRNTCIAPKCFQQTVPLINEILTHNGIHNVALHLKIGPKYSTPFITFDTLRSDRYKKPHFVLQLPRCFASYDTFFQRGNLEHEVAHVTAAHGKIVGDVLQYIAQQQSRHEQEILYSESMQKWMRACEYEADLLPAAKNGVVAEQIICALGAAKVTDELHPPTRKRIKMLKRVQRLHETYERQDTMNTPHLV